MSKLSKLDRINIVFDQVRVDGSVLITKKQLIEKCELWLDFNYEDWLAILDRIKNNPLKLYAFITFAFTILGIELIHEFSKLKEVRKNVEEYVDNGKRFPIHSISEFDIKFYQKNTLVIEAINKSLYGYKEHGAILIEEYQVRSHRVVDNAIKRYIRIIKRNDITMIAIGELIGEEYLVSARQLKKM